MMWYAVRRKQKPDRKFILCDWDETSAIVLNVSGFVFKKFKALRDAIAFVDKQNGAVDDIIVMSSLAWQSEERVAEINALEAHTKRFRSMDTKATKRAHGGAGGAGGAGVDAAKRSRVDLSWRRHVQLETDTTIHVWVDGSCLLNGTKRAVAGIGAVISDVVEGRAGGHRFYEDGVVRRGFCNVSRPVRPVFEMDASGNHQVVPPTNQGAELEAFVCALEMGLDHFSHDNAADDPLANVHIHTDSAYVFGYVCDSKELRGDPQRRAAIHAARVMWGRLRELAFAVGCTVRATKDKGSHDGGKTGMGRADRAAAAGSAKAQRTWMK